MSSVAAVVFIFILTHLTAAEQDFLVYRGEDADIANYPYIVSIRWEDQHNCGGSILSRTVIVTAAHCLSEAAQHSVTIRVGSSYHARGVSYRISRFLMHPRFNRATATNDIGLVFLQTQLAYGGNVQPARMAQRRLDPGSNTYIVGWGMYYQNSQMSLQLRIARAQVETAAQCSRKQEKFAITAQMVCVSNWDGHNSCPGDSGGPLIDAGTGNIIGVSSYTWCGSTKGSVYTSIPDYLQWIQNSM